LCSALGSNAEPDASIEHAAAPVEAAQDPNMTVVPDRDANVSPAQTVNDAARIMPSVSIAPANTSCDILNSAASTHDIPPEFFAAFDSAGKQFRSQFGQPCRSAGHSAVYARDSALARIVRSFRTNRSTL